jgi:hypothetical protein
MIRLKEVAKLCYLRLLQQRMFKFQHKQTTLLRRVKVRRIAAAVAGPERVFVDNILI